jgi:hypothetical protein
MSLSLSSYIPVALRPRYQLAAPAQQNMEPSLAEMFKGAAYEALDLERAMTRRTIGQYAVEALTLRTAATNYAKMGMRRVIDIAFDHIGCGLERLGKTAQPYADKIVTACPSLPTGIQAVSDYLQETIPANVLHPIDHYTQPSQLIAGHRWLEERNHQWKIGERIGYAYDSCLEIVSGKKALSEDEKRQAEETKALRELILGSGGRRYTPFAQRLDRFFIQNAADAIQSYVDSIPEEERIEGISFGDAVRALISGQTARRVAQYELQWQQRQIADALTKTMITTTDSRQKLIEAIEAATLSLMYEKLTPSKRTLLREALLCGICCYKVPLISSTASCLPTSLTSHLPEAKMVEIAPIELSDHFLGCLPCLVKCPLQFTASKAIEYGPALHLLWNETLPNLIKKGNEDLNRPSILSSLNEWLNPSYADLVRQIDFHPAHFDQQALEAAKEKLIQERGAIQPILARMIIKTFDDNRLEGPLRLFKLILKDIMRKKPAVPQAPEIRGMREAKAAFGYYLNDLKRKFLVELLNTIPADLERQRADATQAVAHMQVYQMNAIASVSNIRRDFLMQIGVPQAIADVMSQNPFGALLQQIKIRFS